MPSLLIEQGVRRLLSDNILRAAMIAGRRFQASSKATIIFAPHPDDETFGCGGLIALKAALGARLKIVIMTDGGASFGDLDPSARETLVKQRQAEVVAAAEALGVESGNFEFLSYPDDALAGIASDSEVGPMQRVRSTLSSFRPQEIFVPHRHDRHPDHEATYQIVAAACRQLELEAELFEYPIWLIWWSGFKRRLSPRDLSGAHVLCIADVLDRKRQALAQFASQYPTLPRGFLNRFLWSREIYFKSEISSGDDRLPSTPNETSLGDALPGG